MLISSAYAQAAGAAPSGGLSTIIQFAPIALIFVVFYFVLLRPQQTAQKALRARLASIKRGDRVVTGGGIIATVQKAAEGATEIEVDLAPNVRVTVLRSTITTVLTPAAEPKANDNKA
jgi:preprotein translocase subunit YajC